MKTGVLTEPSRDRLERWAAQRRTTVVFPAKAAACNAASDGSRFASGIEPARATTTPDFATPCGISAA